MQGGCRDISVRSGGRYGPIGGTSGKFTNGTPLYGSHQEEVTARHGEEVVPTVNTGGG